uniref:Lipoprotein n=1 Tax=Meloidogyne floridensis TaxID=298350 RepID=A0A915P714_9BILA
MWRIFVCIILFKSACSVKHKGESSNNQEQKITENEEEIFIGDDEIIKNINTAFPGAIVNASDVVGINSIDLNNFHINIKIESGINYEELPINLNSPKDGRRYFVKLFKFNKSDGKNFSQLIAQDFTKNYDNISFKLENNIVADMKPIKFKNKLVYTTNNLFAVSVFQGEEQKIYLKFKEINIIELDPMLFDSPRRQMFFTFENKNYINPKFIYCNKHPKWILQIINGNSLFKLNNACKWDEYILQLKYLNKDMELHTNCGEALSSANVNLYYINFVNEQNGNIRALCQLVGYFPFKELNNKNDLENLLKKKTLEAINHINVGHKNNKRKANFGTTNLSIPKIKKEDD